MNQLIQVPIDKWSTREKLALASYVSTAPDRNWYSVSRFLKPFSESNRPPDWLSQKNCATQYNQLLDKVETPKRKRGDKNERSEKNERGEQTAQNLIVRKLTEERIKELKEEIERDKKQLEDLNKNVNLLKNENLSETDKKIIENQMIEAFNQAKRDEEAHQLWLKERDEKYSLISRKKSSGAMKTPRKEDLNTTNPISIPSTSTTLIPSTSTTLISSTSTTLVSSTSTTPITNQDNSSQNANNDTNNNLTVSQDDQTQLIIKQEKLTAQELLSNEQTVTDSEKPIDEQQKVDLVSKEDKPIFEKQLDKDKINDSTTTNLAEKMEIAVVEQPVDKMEVDIDQSLQKNKPDVDNKGRERLSESIKEENNNKEEQQQTETIISNKRKRTSSSISLPTPNTPTPIVQANQQNTPTTSTQTPTTRRSGRLKPLRSTTISKTELSVTLAEQKKVLISANSDEPNIVPLNTSQMILNDESTKDSTTSGDVTDTYTSPNSPASSILNIDHGNDPEQIREQKEHKAWKKSILLLLKQAATHKYSTLFNHPVTDDDAEGYSTVVFKPIDLTMIKKKIENGQIKTTIEFQKDIMLMFQNAIMYNSVKHEVHQMTIEMQKEILESIEDFINDQKSSQSTTKEISSSRRKSRTL